MTTEAEFVPVRGKSPVQDHGPLCECNSPYCHAVLTVEAWGYQSCVTRQMSQVVVAPGHEDPGERTVFFDGFSVSETDEL